MATTETWTLMTLLGVPQDLAEDALARHHQNLDDACEWLVQRQEYQELCELD